jgi:uncharacterized protein YdiU (UPF0061 family)
MHKIGKNYHNRIDNFAGFQFDNSYARLPCGFYEAILPAKSENPSLIRVNDSLLEEFGLDLAKLQDEEAARFFSGNYIAPGSFPIALAYAGHQFGRFVPVLGDGRAHLLGELVNKRGERFDIQLKGSGRTSFSRNGDGRATLASVMREYIVSEAMHGLKIKTTRSLAFVTTGEFVQRETALPGAILTRIASSHIRVGTFEYFAARGDTDAVKILSDYTIKRHYPACAKGSNPYISLLREVMDAYAKLVASWMGIGFIHGVMNTDNTTISGETIDYGPCAFMDEYDHDKVFSSIDKHGRYAYSNQPNIAKWNLNRFALSIISLIDEDPTKANEIIETVIGEFDGIYQAHWLAIMRRKLGLFSARPDDDKLINDLLDIMHKGKMDFTITFRQLSDLIPLSSHSLPSSTLPSSPSHLPSSQRKLGPSDEQSPEGVTLTSSRNCLLSWVPGMTEDGRMTEGAGMTACEDGTDYAGWIERWIKRLEIEGKSRKEHVDLMESSNPARIPRNHLIEEAIKAATESNDFSMMDEMLSALEKPFVYHPDHQKYASAPTPNERIRKTFCGT